MNSDEPRHCHHREVGVPLMFFAKNKKCSKFYNPLVFHQKDFQIYMNPPPSLCEKQINWEMGILKLNSLMLRI